MITIIDYGMGNLRSVQKAFELFYPNVRISSSCEDVLSSNKIVLPGVGAFGKAMEELRKRHLAKAIKEAIEKGSPFLGICLGLQLLFSESEEGGRVKGLGVLSGKVRKFKNVGGLKIPHMGWNRIVTRDPSTSLASVPSAKTASTSARGGAGNRQEAGILNGVPEGSYMYFVHSYVVEPKDKDVILCETDYGETFASGIEKDNVRAFQFHPEKSQGVGLKIIKNFVEL